jgi:hypothetical protein
MNKFAPNVTPLPKDIPEAIIIEQGPILASVPDLLERYFVKKVMVVLSRLPKHSHAEWETYNFARTC